MTESDFLQPRELLKEFNGRGEVKGHKFYQLVSSPEAYIYKVVSDSGLVYYEVFRRKINKRFGNVSYPTSKSFGIWAWCCMTLDDARAIYINLHEDGKPQKSS